MRILLEDSYEFKPDRSRISIVESKVGERTRKATRIPGTIAEADVIGGNKRRYPKRVWENNLREDSSLQAKIRNAAAWGLLEHPKDGIVDLTSPIAFHLVEAKMLPDGKIEGVIEIYEDLNDGHKLMVLIEHGYNPLVSTRGMGSIKKAADGVDEVDDDYICEGADVVATPSFTGAKLRPQREALTNFPAAGRVSESATETPKAAEITSKANRKEHTMNITQVRESIPTLRSFDPSKSTPAQLSEGFNRITEMHKALAAESASAPATSWECNRLHEELNAVEQTWASALAAPKAEAAKLTESNKKLVALTETAVRTVKQYRNSLSEMLKKHSTSNQMVEALVGKVRGWQKHCEALKAKYGTQAEKLEVVTEALDLLAAKYKTESAANKQLQERLQIAAEALDLITEAYHRDTTKLSANLLEKRFPDAVKADDVKKQLAEAKTMKEVLKIKESLKAASKVTTEAKAVKPAAKVVESVKPATTEQVAKPTETGRGAVVIEAVQAINMRDVNPSSLNEAVELTRRMSTSQKINA